MLWQILVQFLFRLAGGLAFAMALTSARLVPAGFFRVHLWVGLGLNTFAAVVVFMVPDFPARQVAFAMAVVAAVLSYIGAVIWLYEKRQPGQVALWLVTLANLVGALFVGHAANLFRSPWLLAADVATASLLLGTTFAAMLLGHWYLNTPTMKLAPLNRLTAMMAIAVGLRAIASLVSHWQGWPATDGQRATFFALLALHWLAGLVGVLGMAGMTWQTLKIPNTQSATGILYVAVIFVFLGELSSQLLSLPLA